jgi:hypothetical protein
VTDAYRQFLEQKIRLDHATGFDVAPEQIASLYPLLKPHQAAIVRWAVQGGCRAIFAAFGLGKTFMQLVAVDLLQVKLPEGSPSLIVMPLGVRQEFIRDAEKLAIDVRFIRTDAEVDPGYGGIHLTNYESVREGKINPGQFSVASLDEASILRSFGSKTYQEFLTAVRPRAVPLRGHGDAEPEPLQGADPLRRLPRDHGHRPGADAVLPARPSRRPATSPSTRTSKPSSSSG